MNMDINTMSKSELLVKCQELNIVKCKSKNKEELIKLIAEKMSPQLEQLPLEHTQNLITLEPNVVAQPHVITEYKIQAHYQYQYIITPRVSYYNIDALKFTTDTKFDLIYLDPPYETNRTFTVNSLDDNTGFTDVWKKDEYLEWIQNLITTLKPLLSVQGTLVFHISSENSFIVESVLVKHFKQIQKIYWKRCHGKNTVKNKMGEVMDIIFACNNGNNIFNMLYIPIEENSVWAFKNKDDRGEYSLGALKHDRSRIGNVYQIVHDGITYENKYGWKQKKEVVEDLIKDNRIHFVPKQKNMYVKIYKHEHKGIPLSNLWNDIHSITRTSLDPRLYPTQKPQKLLERIIRLFTNENSYVLDPVCGSGTTGFVTDKLNRNCVMCDINPDTQEIIKKRFADGIYNL